MRKSSYSQISHTSTPGFCDIMEQFSASISPVAPNTFHSAQSGSFKNYVEVKCFSSETGLQVGARASVTSGKLLSKGAVLAFLLLACSAWPSQSRCKGQSPLLFHRQQMQVSQSRFLLEISVVR